MAHLSVQVVSVSEERIVARIAFRDDPEDENAYATKICHFIPLDLKPLLWVLPEQFYHYGQRSEQRTHFLQDRYGQS